MHWDRMLLAQLLDIAHTNALRNLLPSLVLEMKTMRHLHYLMSLKSPLLQHSIGTHHRKCSVRQLSPLYGVEFLRMISVHCDTKLDSYLFHLHSLQVRRDLHRPSTLVHDVACALYRLLTISRGSSARRWEEAGGEHNFCHPLRVVGGMIDFPEVSPRTDLTYDL